MGSIVTLERVRVEFRSRGRAGEGTFRVIDEFSMQVASGEMVSIVADSELDIIDASLNGSLCPAVNVCPPSPTAMLVVTVVVAPVAGALPMGLPCSSNWLTGTPTGMSPEVFFNCLRKTINMASASRAKSPFLPISQ